MSPRLTLKHRVWGALSRSERIRMLLLERDLAALDRDYRRDIAGARKSGGDLGEIQSRYSSDVQLVDEELEGMRTERLLRRARALRIPLPSYRPHGFNFEDGDENWVLGSVMGQWTLTTEGEHRLRQSIRDEEKARREHATFWLGIWATAIGVATGLVGAIAALIAVGKP